MPPPHRIPPGPGQESVWDYPRPPALVACRRRVRVQLFGGLILDTTSALRVLETSHPPTIYVPPGDVRPGLLRQSHARPSVCEFKGVARYVDAVDGDRRVAAIGWSYPDPVDAYAALRDHIAFYPSRVQAAWLGDELVQAQESDFYGGWVTTDLIGPFKGPPGTRGW